MVIFSRFEEKVWGRQLHIEDGVNAHPKDYQVTTT